MGAWTWPSGPSPVLRQDMKRDTLPETTAGRKPTVFRKHLLTTSPGLGCCCAIPAWMPHMPLGPAHTSEHA
eukprot:8269134-Alexandrium_andersonii.AAC.1